MEKIKKILAGLFIAAAATAPALAKDVVLSSPAQYQVVDISPNGKWATGVYVDFSSAAYGFLWNLESNTTTLLSASHESFGYSVSNDGVVAGNFYDVVGTFEGQRPGYYKDGQWYGCEIPVGAVLTDDGNGYGITPDGQYMSGNLYINGTYQSFIWKNGEIYMTLKPNTKGYDSAPYTIAPDGQSAAGWSYLTGHSQRVATLWKGDAATGVAEGVALHSYETIWCNGRKFSDDGKKLLFWAGFDHHDDGHLTLRGLYDMETGTSQGMYAGPDDFCNTDMWDISDNGTAVGVAYGVAYVFTADTCMTMEKYFEKEGIDVSAADPYIMENGSMGLEYGLAITGDEKTIAVYYGANDRYERTMVVRRDVNPNSLAPANVSAAQLEGINAVKLSWFEATGAEGVKGYNVYRDGVKLNTELVTEYIYYDKALELDKPYAYTVAAVQADDTETEAEPVSITLAAKQATLPTGLFARQKGLNSAYLSWNAPASNFFPKGYMTDGELAGFGSNQGNMIMEAAIAFDGNEIACYEGCKVGKISFIPMSAAKEWKVNFYTRKADGTLEELYTQPITQELSYRERNTVVLDQPVAVPSTGIIAAIEVAIETPNVTLMGVHYGNTEPGYSDLVRMKGVDADLYSLFDASSESGTAISVRWQMEIVLMPEGAEVNSDVIDHYSITDGDKEVATSKTTSHIVPDLADGNHNLGVKAVYANNTESPAQQTALEIKSAYKPVSEIDLGYDGDIAIFNWKAPADDDATYITYANGPLNSVTGRVPSGYTELMVGAEYGPDMLKSYDGYTITGAQFYPLSDALFTVMIYEDDVLISETEVEDYVLNTMNTVQLAEPVEIKPNSSYILVIDCFDLTESAVIACDQSKPKEMISDLYSFDGLSFSSISGDASVKGSWMIGIEIADLEGKAIPVTGYDINIDGAKHNAETLTANTYSFDATTMNNAEGRHTVSVDVYYQALPAKVEGEKYYFYYNASVADNVIAEIKLEVADSYLKVLGDGVKEVAAYAINGMKVASVNGDTLPITDFAPGVYVVTVKTANGTTSHKVKITK